MSPIIQTIKPRQHSRKWCLAALICASGLLPFVLWRQSISHVNEPAVSRPARHRAHFSVTWQDSAHSDLRPQVSTQGRGDEPAFPDEISEVSLECDVLTGLIREPGAGEGLSSPPADRAFFALQHNSRAWVAHQHGLLHAWADAPAAASARQRPRRRNTARSTSGASVPAFLAGLRPAVAAGSTWPLSALVPLPSAVLAPCLATGYDGAGPLCPDLSVLLRASNSSSIWEVLGLHPADAIQVAAPRRPRGVSATRTGCGAGPAIGRRVVFQVDAPSVARLSTPEVGLVKRALGRACTRLSRDVAARLVSAVQAAGALLVEGIFADGEAEESLLNASRGRFPKNCHEGSEGTFRRIAVSIWGSDAEALLPAATAAASPPLSVASTAAQLARSIGGEVVNASSLAERIARLPKQRPPPAVLPHSRMDERYALELQRAVGGVVVASGPINASTEYVAHIVSPTVWGALRGLVTAVDLLEGWALPTPVQGAPELILASAFFLRCQGLQAERRKGSSRAADHMPLWLSTDMTKEASRLAAAASMSLTSQGCNRSAGASWFSVARRAVEIVGLTEAAPGLSARLPLAIADAPLRRWRGLLLDVARTFFVPADIRALMDALEAHKASVLHLHLSDAQAWPLDLQTLPELGRSGAWSADRVYTATDLAELVAYAADRGLRVVPELDLPSHSFALAATPAFRPFFSGCVDNQAGRLVGLGKPCYSRGARDPAGRGGDRASPRDFAARDMPGPLPGVHEAMHVGVCMRGKAAIALDASRRGALETVTAALVELAGIFPDTVFHVGADEVDLDCFGDADTDAWARAHLQSLVGQARKGGSSEWPGAAAVAPPPVARAAALAFFLRAVTRVVGVLGKQSLTWSDSRLDLEDRASQFADVAAREGHTVGERGERGSGSADAAPRLVVVSSIPAENRSQEGDPDAVVWDLFLTTLVDRPRVIDSLVSEGSATGLVAPRLTPFLLLSWVFVTPLHAAWRTAASILAQCVSAFSPPDRRGDAGALRGDSLASFASPSGVGLQSWRCSSHRMERDLVAVLRDDVWRAHAAALGAGSPTWAEATGGTAAPRFAARGAPVSITSLRPLLQSACWYLDGTDSWARLHTVSALPISAMGMASTAQLQCALAKQRAVEEAVARHIAGSTAVSGATVNLSLPLPSQACAHWRAMGPPPSWPTVLADSAGPWIGAEGAVWTEEVDAVNLECRVWPRASVQLEAAWSESAAYARYALGLQAVATSAGRLSPTMDDYRAFAWASAGHKDRNVTDHLAAFLAPRLAGATLRLWRRGIAASPVAVFDFEETYAVARLTAALGTEVDTRHGRASFLQQSLPLPTLPLDMAELEQVPSVNASALPGSVARGSSQWARPPWPLGVGFEGPLLSVATSFALPGRLQDTSASLVPGHFCGSCGPGHFSAWPRRLIRSDKGSVDTAPTIPLSHFTLSPGANQLVVDVYPHLVTPQWAGWVGGAAQERESLRDAGAAFAVVFVAAPREELLGTTGFEFRPSKGSGIPELGYWRRLAAMRNRHPCPRIDSLGDLEHWQTETQLLRSARNGFPYAYFLPTAGPGAIYLLSVAPVIGIFAHNALPGLPLRPGLVPANGGHSVCSESTSDQTLCSPIAAVGCHALLVSDSGGVRFVVISLGSAPAGHAQGRSGFRPFDELLARVASATSDTTLPLLVIAHVDAYFGDGSCDCECPAERQYANSSQPPESLCRCDCFACLAGVRAALMHAARVTPLAAYPVTNRSDNSSCNADLSSLVLVNDAFLAATSLRKAAPSMTSVLPSAAYKTRGESATTIRQLDDTTSAFCAWVRDPSPTLVRQRAGSGFFHEEVEPPLSLLCRW